jgi:serine/threonine protein kinase
VALLPGTRLGAYEVAAQIGMGGMGEVYRATDTNLKRQVALKVLPASLAGVPERLVFRDRLVRRAISLIDRPSRSRILRPFAYIAMVCTSSSLHGLTRSGRLEHPGQFSASRTAIPWSVFSERQQI